METPKPKKEKVFTEVQFWTKFELEMHKLRDVYDERYVRKDELERLIITAIEKVEARRIDNISKKTSVVNNLFQLAQTLAPYIIMVAVWMSSKG